MSSISSKLKMVNPDQNFSQRDLLEQLMEEQRALSAMPQYDSPQAYDQHMGDISSQFGLNTPRYWGDFAEGVGQATPVDYSGYMPRERFDMAEALRVARAVGPENRELALSAMTPRSVPMKRGFEAFLEGAAPLINSGISNANKKKDIYVKEYEQQWKDAQERKRKLKKAEFDFALQQYKIDQRNQIEREKMSQKERMHQQNVALKQQEILSRRIQQNGQLERNETEKEVEKQTRQFIGKNYNKSPGLFENLGSLFTGETNQSRARAIYEIVQKTGLPPDKALEVYENGGVLPAKKKEILENVVERVEPPYLQGNSTPNPDDLIQMARETRQLNEEGKLPYQQRGVMDVLGGLATGFGKSAGKELAGIVDKASWLGRKIPLVGKVIPETRLEESDVFKLSDNEKEKPIQRLGNEIGKEIGSIPLAMALIPGGAALGKIGKSLGYTGKLGKSVSDWGKFWKKGNRGIALTGATGAGIGNYIGEEYIPDTDSNKGLKKLGLGLVGGSVAGAVPQIINNKFRKNIRPDALEMFDARKAIGLETGYGDITNNGLVLNYLANAAKTLGTSTKAKAKASRDFEALKKGFPELGISDKDVFLSDLGEKVQESIVKYDNRIMGPLRKRYQDLSENVLKKKNKEFIAEEIKKINKKVNDRIKEEGSLFNRDIAFKEAEKEVEKIKKKGIPLSKRGLREEIAELSEYPVMNELSLKRLEEFEKKNPGLLEMIEHVKKIGKEAFSKDSKDQGQYIKIWSTLKDSVRETILDQFGKEKGRKILKNLEKLNAEFSSEKKVSSRLEREAKRTARLEGKESAVALGKLLLDNTTSEGASVLDVIRKANPEAMREVNTLLGYFLAKGRGEISPKKIRTALKNIKSRKGKALLENHLTPEEKKIRDNSDIVYDQVYDIYQRSFPNTGSLNQMNADLNNLVPTFNGGEAGVFKALKGLTSMATKNHLLKKAYKPLTRNDIQRALEKQDLSRNFLYMPKSNDLSDY